MARIGWLAAFGLLALACTACGESGSAGSGSGSGGASSSSSSGAGAGQTTASSVDECLEVTGIELDCSEVSLNWVAYLPGVGCSGSSGDGGQLLQLMFRLDETPPSGEPLIRSLRMSRLPDRANDLLVTFDAPVPTPHDSIGVELDWPGVLKPMTLAGGLSFLELHPDDTTLSLNEALPVNYIEPRIVSGSFSMSGGDADFLASDGSVVNEDTPGAEVRGCFRLPADLYPIDF